MEPRFHSGDLAIVKPASDYKVGTIAAYKSSTLNGTVVLHRITAINHGRFTFKGDNNNFTDPDHPSATDLVGSLRARVPHGGEVRAALAQPRVGTAADPRSLRNVLHSPEAFAPARRVRRRRTPARPYAGIHRGGRRGRLRALARRWRVARAPHPDCECVDAVPPEREARLLGHDPPGRGVRGRPRPNRRPCVHAHDSRSNGRPPLRVRAAGRARAPCAGNDADRRRSHERGELAAGDCAHPGPAVRRRSTAPNRRTQHERAARRPRTSSRTRPASTRRPPPCRSSARFMSPGPPGAPPSRRS